MINRNVSLLRLFGSTQTWIQRVTPMISTNNINNILFLLYFYYSKYYWYILGIIVGSNYQHPTI